MKNKIKASYQVSHEDFNKQLEKFNSIKSSDKKIFSVSRINKITPPFQNKSGFNLSKSKLPNYYQYLILIDEFDSRKDR